LRRAVQRLIYSSINVLTVSSFRSYHLSRFSLGHYRAGYHEGEPCRAPLPEIRNTAGQKQKRPEC